jgi:hypothetical protein
MAGQTLWGHRPRILCLHYLFDYSPPGVIPESREADSSGIYSALALQADPGQLAGASFRDDTL